MNGHTGKHDGTKNTKKTWPKHNITLTTEFCCDIFQKHLKHLTSCKLLNSSAYYTFKMLKRNIDTYRVLTHILVSDGLIWATFLKKKKHQIWKAEIGHSSLWCDGYVYLSPSYIWWQCGSVAREFDLTPYLVLRICVTNYREAQSNY